MPRVHLSERGLGFPSQQDPALLLPEFVTFMTDSTARYTRHDELAVISERANGLLVAPTLVYNSMGSALDFLYDISVRSD